MRIEEQLKSYLYLKEEAKRCDQSDTSWAIT